MLFRSCLAISRPGASSFIGQFCDYLHKGIYNEIHPIVDRVLKPTGGCCLFQEQLLQMLNGLGMDLAECEGLRKAIGKKLPEKIKEYREKIYKVCEDNKHPKEIADLIWKIAEDSSGYSFNKSHAVAYASLSAATTYIKVNYPLEFFLAALKMSKNEPDTQEYISSIRKELPKFGVQLMPPDLLISELDFSIKNGKIYFGLGSIKNVAEKSFEKLLKFRKDYGNKFEMFQAANQAGLNLTVLSSLIMAGTLDSLITASRSHLIMESQLWNILTDKEKLKVIELAPKFNNSLVDIVKYLVDEKQIKESRFDTIKTRYAPYKEMYLNNKKYEKFSRWSYEKTMLGFSYSTTLKDIFKKDCPQLLQISDINYLENNEKCEFICEIKKCYSAKSKRGKRYLKLEVCDDTGNTNVMIHGDERIAEYKEINGNYPKEEEIFHVKGSKGDGIIFADRIARQDNTVFLKKSELKVENQPKLT